MTVIALADFGSTFTKIVLVDDEGEQVLARSQFATTASTDVMEGYGVALRQALASAPSLSEDAEIGAHLAASSAGGGLRMAAVGLIPELTAAAASQAALNAGAKVELVLSGRLGEEDLNQLDRVCPEILLFAGGTNGGQEDQVIENAKVLAQAAELDHVVVACNETIAPQISEIFGSVSHRVVDVVPNVLPSIDTLEVGPAREAIHELFVKRVILGKGLSTSKHFSRSVLMPTPEAVLTATELCAFGTHGSVGVGSVLVVDVGGATTDVHSAAHLSPDPVYVTRKGLPPLSIARSVQGDLGVRLNAPEVCRIDGEWMLRHLSDHEVNKPELKKACLHRRDNPSMIAETPVDVAIDEALTISCIAHALDRHCGTMSTVYIHGQGAMFVGAGLDLREVPLFIGTGGVLSELRSGEQLLHAALKRQKANKLVPRGPSVLVDREYILASAGLLASRDPRLAFRLLSVILEGL